MIETLNKIAYKSDEIISSVPMPLYFAIICIGVLAVGQATYDYVNQDPFNNLTINLSLLNDNNYLEQIGLDENKILVDSVNIEEEKVIIKNLETGEVWDSVKDFRYRNK